MGAFSPISVIESVSACPKAPLRFCSQLVNGAVVHWVSAVHPVGGVAGFWKPPSGFLQKAQKICDFPFPAPVLNAGFVDAETLVSLVVDDGMDTFLVSEDPDDMRAFAKEVAPRVREEVEARRSRRAD